MKPKESKFKEWRGACSWDMPQELFRESDFYLVEVKLNIKKVESVSAERICDIDWTKVRGWKRLDEQPEIEKEKVKKVKIKKTKKEKKLKKLKKRKKK